MPEVLKERLRSVAANKGHLSEKDILAAADEFGVGIVELEKVIESLQSDGVLFWRDSEENGRDDEHGADKALDSKAQDRLLAKLERRSTLLSACVKKLLAKAKEIPADERTIMRQFDNGNRSAIEFVVAKNIRAVIREAIWISENGNIDIEDAFQEGVANLLEAVRRRKSREAAIRAGKIQLILHYRMMRSVVGVSPDFSLNAGRRGKFWMAKQLANGHECGSCGNTSPCIGLVLEVSKYLGMTTFDVIRLLEASEKITSLEVLMQDEGSWSQYSDHGSWKDRLDERICSQADLDVIKGLIRELKERERLVVTGRFGIGLEKGLSLEDFSSILGVTREAVRQIEKRGLRKLERHLRKMQARFCFLERVGSVRKPSSMSAASRKRRARGAWAREQHL